MRFYNGENRALDWIARDNYLRIQGTSSVNYARKNLRFYFQKTASGYTARMSYGEIDGNGQQGNPDSYGRQEEPVPPAEELGRREARLREV